MVTLNQAIADFPMIAWLSEHTKVYDKGGRNFYVDCPICGGSKTLGVWREVKVSHCFRCDPAEGGRGDGIWNGKAGLVKMISLLEHISFGEAIQFVYQRSGYPDPPRTRETIPKILLPEESMSIRDTPDSDPVVKYLKGRDLLHLKSDARVCLDGQYKGRLVLPIFYLGELIGFEAKSYTKQKPPSLFASWFETYDNIYTSRRWNFEYQICFITESIFDAESVELNGIGCFGGFKQGQISKLLELKSKGIRQFIWFLDGDAWDKQVKHILTKTINLFQNFVVPMPKDKDPNSLGRDGCLKLAAEARRVADEFDLTRLSLEFGKY